jgi:hypothetical protein
MISTMACLVWVTILNAQAIEKDQSLPLKGNVNLSGKVFVFPWTNPGLDPDFKASQKTSTQQVMATLETLSLPNKQNLAELAKNENIGLSLNAMRKAKTIWLADLNGIDSEEALFLQPIFCDSGEFLVLSLMLGRVESGLTLALVNQSFNRPKDPSALTGLLVGSVPRLWERLKEAAIKTPRFDHRLKFGLSNEKGSLTSRKGGTSCLNVLLMPEILNKAPIVADLGFEHLSFVRRSLKINTPLERSNKRLHVEWKEQSLSKQQRQLAANFTISDAVFADSVKGPIKESWQVIDLPETFTLPKKLTAAIDAEIDTLKVDDWPLVSKIYGAWAYLDRGRAWGLNMSDRLVVQGDDGIVKGHVVGFFGPGAKVKSPRGFDVTEGAIMYVRKGQRAVKRGQSVSFDPRTFPTAWPPKSDLP